MQLDSSYRAAAIARRVPLTHSYLRAIRQADRQLLTRTLLLFVILFIEALIFTGINGLIDDLLVSFVATIASSLLFLPLMLGGSDH